MSNQAAILVSDIIDIGANHPLGVTTSTTIGASETYTPAGPDKPSSGVFVWENRAGGIEALYPRFTMRVARPQGVGGNNRVSVKYTRPTANVTAPSTGSGIQPLPSVAYALAFNGEFVLPKVCTLAERQAFLSAVLSFFCRALQASDGSPSGNTLSPIFDAVLNYEPIY